MKNYLVIGASSGIGLELSKLLTENGHQVYGTYKSRKPSDQPAGIHYNFLDVLEDELDLSYLPETLDGVIYCPGSINLKPFHRIKPEAFISDFNLQVTGAIKVLQAAYPKLKASDSASVVLFSTIAVQQGFNFHTQVSTSKGAIEGLTRALSAEWAPRIRVNAIAPSLTDTPLAAKLLNSDQKKESHIERHPLKKIGSPEDIAEAAIFLLSEKSSWVTGQVLHVDGGMSRIR